MENEKHMNSNSVLPHTECCQALLICVCLCKAGWGRTEVND